MLSTTMQVRHYKTLMAAQPGLSRTQAVCWSPNNKRLAVADNNRVVNLYDELGERRDRFPTKAADGKNGKSFVIRGMMFSPDSSRIAIAQSDGLVAVYRIGVEWGEKKAICSKFPQNCQVTCLCWPSTSQGVELVVFGTIEGKVKVGILKANKSQTLCAHDHAVVSLASSPITFYDRNGQKVQNFDYKVDEEGEFTAGSFNPSGQTVAIASSDKFRLLDFNLRSRKWEEGTVVKLPNSCCFSAMSWKYDGSRLVTGTLTGAVDMFDTCLKRYRLRGAFEFTYVSHNQVIVKRLVTGSRIVLRSNLGYEVQRVNVHQDRYLVAYTSTTLLVGDLISCKLSEVPWQLSGRERFVFDNPQVCMVFASGELCLIEYGRNELLGTCRTEERNAHRISVRVYEPSGNVENDGRQVRKFIAYLIDRQTIQIDDLGSGIAVARVSHQCRIDWLELNYRANKLLFRDKQHQLFLYDLEEQSRCTLLNYCTYVQWVPCSEVVVAQNRVELCVWYSINSPDRVAVVPIKGEVEGIERGNGKTEVIVDEGVNAVAYALDEALIEFGTTMEDHDYNKACDLLDHIALTPETEAMWSNLAAVALQEMKLHIAQRCYAALGDMAKVNALNRINELAAEVALTSGGISNGYDHYLVRAELSMLNKEYKQAEQLFTENAKIEEAMSMWEELNRFDESISVAEARGWPDLANKRTRYYDWLMETGQFEKAGEQKEREGKFIDAINLYLRGGTPARAANVISVERILPLLPLPADSNLKLDRFHSSFIAVTESMSKSGQKPEDVTKAKAFMHIFHAYYMATHMRELSLDDYALKLMLGLPRWIPHIAPEKAFYDAGMAARNAGNDAIAFCYLNRFLDICERIEDGATDTSAIDNVDFDCTDFPKKYPLPKTSSIDKASEEEVNRWVLANSIENNLDPRLPTITDPQGQVDMFEGALQSPAGSTFPECAVTGYPIVGGGLTKCQECQRPANQDDWNRYILVGKNCPWCGSPQSHTFHA
uniref:Intraflagellar transport protein IFT172,putative n=1 Tax=Trypanosoma vivax (strain Y486) TaxID=1055687 RepID=G0U5A8_TRYVY